MMQMSLEQVLKFLPHRRPFLFVDEIEKILLPNGEVATDQFIPYSDIKGIKVFSNFTVKDELEILTGHFPNNPILPGVIQIEIMAQTACFSIACSVKDISQANLEVALLTCDKAKFRRPVRPGMKLDIQSEVIKVRGKIVTFECQITTELAVISQANIMAQIIET